jgi:poly(3-hydroxybutyrate) depolymerase
MQARRALLLLFLAGCGGGPTVVPGDAAVPAVDAVPIAVDAAAPASPDAARADASADRPAGIGVPVLPPSDAAGISDPLHPAAGFLPAATGACPEMTAGMITVHPQGLGPRDARLWISDAARTLDGPLVFYWYGTNGAPAQAIDGLGMATIDAITAQGGMVIAPVHDPAAGVFPWYLVTTTDESDLKVADELLACAIQKVGVDTRRIHSVGFSAGALHTTQMAYRRSGYLASVVTYSGGQLAPIADQDPSSALSAMIFHGGPNDMVVIGFQAASEQFKMRLGAAGRFAFICNHGMGHRIPTDAVASVWKFLQDHPFGTRPSPYAGGLPAGFPPYCSL